MTYKNIDIVYPKLSEFTKIKDQPHQQYNATIQERIACERQREIPKKRHQPERKKKNLDLRACI